MGLYFSQFFFNAKLLHTVKPVLSGHSKIDKTKVLKTNGSLMKVERLLLEHSAILLTCIKQKSILICLFDSLHPINNLSVI